MVGSSRASVERDAKIDSKAQKEVALPKSITSESKKKEERTFRIELSSGAKTQFADVDQLVQETLEAIQAQTTTSH